MSIDAFSLQVPESWVEFDLSDKGLADLRKQLISKNGRDADIDGAFREARRTFGAARRRGAFYAAGTFEPHEDGLLMANAMMFGVTPPAGQQVSVEMLTRQVNDKQGDGTWRKVSAPVLPFAGSAARVFGVEDIPIDDELTVRMVTMHTIIPIPGERNALILSCASPNLPLADSLLDLFDAIADTFSFA